jgi:2-polyprenyl-6-methoxyphenol hydroxylase-like FAD-dependent oxidoreductase
VRKGVLAGVLQNLAKEAGAVVDDGATVVGAELSPPEVWRRGQKSLVDVHYRAGLRSGSAGAARVVRARFVLDCSGRAQALGSTKRDRGPRTVALVGLWRDESQPTVGDHSYTWVESYPDGWMWSVPVGGQARYIAAMIDPDVVAVTKGAGLQSTYLRELAKAQLSNRVVTTQKLLGGVSAWAATPYQRARFVSPGMLFVGDAAAFIDPLSSYGVKKALASGWLASVSVHTALIDPDREAVAFEFFDHREREAATSYNAQAREFYRTGADIYGHVFWNRRADQPPPPAGPSQRAEGVTPFADPVTPYRASASSGAPDVTLLRKDPRVLAAFRMLRSCEVVDLRIARESRWTEGPSIRGHEIVVEPRIATPSFPMGIRFLGEVDVVVLSQLVEGLNCSESRCGVGRLYQEYLRSAREVTLENFVGALSVLIAEGALANGSAIPSL